VKEAMKGDGIIRYLGNLKLLRVTSFIEIMVFKLDYSVPFSRYQEKVLLGIS